jgi:PAS domain S-box-containing protein
MFENNCAVKLLVDPDSGEIVDANSAACKYYGYAHNDLLDISIWDINTLSKENILSKMAMAKSTRQDNFEFTHRLYDGSHRVVHVFSGPIQIKGRNLLHSIIIDITERREAEKALIESEEKFRKYIEGAPFGIFIADGRGNYLEVNEAACTMTGYTKSALNKMNIKDILETDIKPDKLESLRELKIKGSIKLEFRLKQKNGTIIWSSLDAVTISDNRFMAFCSDITERKKAEESNARLLRAIEQAAECIVITDSDGIIQYVNPVFEKTTGYPIKEVIGENPRIFNSGYHNDSFYKGMWDALLSGNEWRGEITNKKKDGSLYLENAVISPVFDSHGEIVNFVAVKNDITETKRLQELESRAERLETAGTIAGQVAHDFNNLLGPLMAYPEIIRDELPKNHPALEYLEQIEESARKIADINQDLLTMGRRGHHNFEVVNLNDIIGHTISDMDSDVEDLTMNITLGDEVKEILGAGSQLHRMISNLLHNARDSIAGPGLISVKTENFYIKEISSIYGNLPISEYVKLTISDTGCGIPLDIIDKIYDPFFTSKTTDKKRGSGLGMSVVDAVIRDHGGYIGVKTQIGVGTTFNIYLPITMESKDSDLSEEIFGGDEKILIVDDDSIQREVTSCLLEKLGYHVNVVTKGEDALELLKKIPHDLVILDMVMPGGIDGTETYRRIIEIKSNQKAIILSGFSEMERVKEVLSLGAGAFVKKPVTKGDIAKAIRAELDRG